MDEVTLTRFDVNKVRFRWPQRYEFEGVTGRLDIQGQLFDFKFESLVLDSIRDGLRKKTPISFEVVVSQIHGDAAAVQQGSFDGLIEMDPSHVTANFKGVDLEVNHITAENLAGSLEWSSQRGSLHVQSLEMAGGSVVAMINCDFSRQDQLDAYVDLSNLNLSRLALEWAESANVFPVRGWISGDITMGGTLEDLRQWSARYERTNSGKSDLTYKADLVVADGGIGAFIFGPAQINVLGRDDRLNFETKPVGFYGGTLTVDGTMEVVVEPDYEINVDFDTVDLGLLPKEAGGLTSNFKGIVSGALQLAGGRDVQSSIQGKLMAEPGANIKASLLKHVMDYIPNSRQRKNFEEILKKDGFVNLSFAQSEIKNDGNQNLNIKNQLKIKSLNIDYNPEIDIRMDGTIPQWIQSISTIQINRSQP